MIDIQNYYDMINSEYYQSALEIGCGEGRRIKELNCPIRIGIDAFRPILENHNTDNDGTIRINYDLSKGLNNLFINKSIDCIIGIDIIEHFVKEDGFKLIKECEQISKNFVLFFIPVGNHPQTEDDRNLGNDYYQTHRSQWFPEDMISLGYTVHLDENFHSYKTEGDKGAMFCWKYLKD
jgi:hypothetical protein